MIVLASAEELTNISMDLLVALRDVAGLAWGGTEMSSVENGDFMHFDCRQTQFGDAVYDRKSPDEQAEEQRKNAEEAARKKAAAQKKKQ